jgi:glycosyltransferase involved in cell wall biosynthesis
MTIIANGTQHAASLRAINFYAANGCNPYTGYGKLELGIARGLQAAGVRLNVWPDPDAPTLLIGFPAWLTAPHIAKTRRYILTMSESTKVSEKWVDLINWNAEGVFVPCAGLVDVYQVSGIKRPVVCATMGIDLRDVAQAPGWNGEDRFEWLTYSYGDLRKGAELAIMAFKRLFQGDKQHHLTIKSRDDGGWMRAFQRGDDPQISVMFGQQSEREWMDLIARSHCFVFPSRAEGFGMPPREAILAGVPTIATQWLGMADVDRWGLPLKVLEMRTCTYDSYEANAEGGLWAEPSQEHLEEQMKWVYAHYDEAREIARKGAWYLRQNNTWTGMTDIIIREMTK